MKIEDELMELIVSRYGTIAAFVREVELPYSTFKSIMTRGIMNASIGNILKICSALNISADELANGKIVPVETKTEEKNIEDIVLDFKMRKPKEIELDNEPLTSEELSLLSDSLEISIEMLRRRRARNKRFEVYSEGVSELIAKHSQEAKSSLYDTKNVEMEFQKFFDALTEKAKAEKTEARENG